MILNSLRKIKTNNTIYDKQIASYELEHYYLNNFCRNNSFILDRGRQICKLFLNNKYIAYNIKKKIIFFLNEMKNNNIIRINYTKEK